MSASKDAYSALNTAIDQLVASDDELAQELPETVTDAVLLLGVQFFTDGGDRCGRVLLYPRNGSQPYYITEGLLHAGLSVITGTTGEES